MLLELLVALLCVLGARFLWRRWKYDMHKIPAPPGLPVFGHLPGLAKTGEMSIFRGYWWKKLGYPKMMKIEIGRTPLLHVMDMKCAKSVVLSDANLLPKSFLSNKVLITLMGNDRSVKSMVHSTDSTPYVKAVRGLYATGFRTDNLKACFPKLHEVFDTLIEAMDAERKNGALEFQSLCTKLTIDAIGIVAFGANLGGLDGSRHLHSLIIELGHESVQSVFRPYRKLTYFLASGRFADPEYEEKVKCLTAEWDKLVHEILNREDPATGEEPMWYCMKHFVDPETGKPIARDSLLSEVAAVVVGGMDTTGHQLAWIFAVLASNPHVVDKVLVELEEHGLYGANSREVALDDLTELSYLTAVVKEGIRIAHATIGTFFRRLRRDATILGYRIPKGTLLTVPGSRFLCSEAEWGDPDVFRPERWLTDEDMSDKLNIGFSSGPRDCVGRKLAMVEMRMAIIRVLTKYEILPTDSFDEVAKNIRNGVAIEARDGIWLKVKPRVEKVA